MPDWSIYDLGDGLLAYSLCLAALLGAALGSFLNCAAWRIARGENFLTGRSRCPDCGHVLGPADLVPVFSWLFLRGRCRWCGGRISPRYVLTELLFAALTALCLLRFDFSVLFIRNLLLLCCLFCLALTDLDSMIIPDGCLAAAVLVWAASLGFLWAGWRDLLLRLLTGAVCFGVLLLLALLMDRLLKKQSLGGGDIKLLAVLGLYFGPAGTLFTVLLSCGLGLVQCLVQGMRGRQFPFGPAIAAAAAIMLFWGEGLTAWYLSLLA